MLATRHMLVCGLSWEDKDIFMIELCSQKQQGCCDRFTQMGIVFTKTVGDQSGLFY